MIGNLEPEENVMDDSVMYPGGMLGQLAIALEKMGWESGDDVVVEIAGTSAYEIDGAATGAEYATQIQGRIPRR